ncbi:MAG: sugar-binding domain-containing protein [Gemmatimonadota bacterium]
MERIDLSGAWELAWFAEGRHAVSGPADLEGLPLQWIAAEVPGNVELDLERAGLLPELFHGTHIYRLRELEACQWWYRRRFEAPAGAAGRRARLVFHGLDCFATVWLNGQEVGRSANMLVQQAFEVTGRLAAGLNEVVVRLGSAVNEARRHEYPPSLTTGLTNYEHLPVRKAPHMYGWDIMPRAVSAGLWRPVALELPGDTGIDDLYYTTRRAGEAGADLLVHWQFRTPEADLSGFRLRFAGRDADGATAFAQEVVPRFVAGAHTVHVAAPRLWWPRGYGEPHLYEVTCQLVRDGAVVDERRDRVGLRTVELERTDVTTAERPGQFRFRCNGVPVFCKGSNWVPADAFHSRDAGRYERMLDLFDDLGCNMVRCWGGNVYEDHAFYARCDRSGLLVWQDFAFACGLYPQHAGFLEQVRQEATAVVRKLRNHPSIALWSGDNEVDDVYMALGLDPGANRLTREVLPEVCRIHDPWRAYLPSSPYAAPEVVRSGDRGRMPEQHLWGPRDYYKSPFYARHTAHFASEIGYHGCPNVSSIRRFIDADHLWPWAGNDQWRCHAADAVPEGGPHQYRIKLMADQIGELFGAQPNDLEAFALASQISQAEAKKFFIESFRLRKWRTTGLLWWNVIDGWPQFSDAVVDYYFGRKLAYWYIRRSQRPVCVMVDEPDAWQCRVAAGNDTRQPARGRFRVWDADGGQVLLEGALEVPANGTQELGRIRASRGDQRLWLIEWETEAGSGGNHYLLGTPPFSFERYRAWLPRIAALPDGFDAEAVAR